jgi:hypothetical protein
MSATPPEASGLALVILPAELNGLVATLNPNSGVLQLDPAASREEQLEAVAGAAAYLLRSDPGQWRRERHLRVVGEVGA